MKTFFKVMLAIALSLAVSSLLASRVNTSAVYSEAVYIFFNMILYHWWIYFPFVGIHFISFRCSKPHTWWLSMVLGTLLAVIITLGLVSSSDPIINLSGEANKFMTAISFGVGGSLYGLLYYFWLDKPPHTKLW